jgi:hypothetical protein
MQMSIRYECTHSVIDGVDGTLILAIWLESTGTR